MRTVQFHSRQHVRTLAGLVAEAKAYAEEALRAAGSVRPTLLALTPRGTLAHYPARLAIEEDKEFFAIECRLVLVATQATACAMVLESWMADVVDGKLPTVAPSQHPERKEIVTLCAESRTQQQFLTLPIERTVLGVFVRLGENTAPAGITGAGRFANLLPRKSVSLRDAHKAESALESLGIRLATTGFSQS